MKYFCTTCNYNYDEAFWDEIEEKEAGTKIWNMEICPNCGEVDSFLFVKEEVNYVDENTFLIKELEHFIEIEQQEENWNLKVIIWESEHPMDENHTISSVSLFDEYWDLVEEKFLKNEVVSETFFSDYGLDNFEIRVKCNKHWVFARKFEFL